MDLRDLGPRDDGCSWLKVGLQVVSASGFVSRASGIYIYMVYHFCFTRYGQREVFFVAQGRKLMWEYLGSE